MNDVYLLNSPFTFQAMEKHAAYCVMIRLGLKVPPTVLVPHKDPPDNGRFQYTASRYNLPFDLTAIADKIGYPLFMKPYDGGQWIGVSRVRDRDELTRAYDESGRRLMHLQASVEGFDVFARSLSIGPETTVASSRRSNSAELTQSSTSSSTWARRLSQKSWSGRPRSTRLGQPSSTRPTSGPSSRRERRDRPGSASSRCVGVAPARSRSSCSNAIGRQRSSTSVCGSSCAISATSTLEVLGPQPQPRGAGELGVVGDDVHLGVVEQRVRVEVRRADRQPAVVDDPDLRVHVQTIVALAAQGANRASRAGRPCPSSAAASTPSCPSVSSWPLFAFAGSSDHEPELVAWGPAELVREQPDDLRRPQELVLEVDESARAARSRGRSSRGSGTRRRGPRRTCRSRSSARPGPCARRAGAGAAGRSSCSPVSSRQRSAKWSSTSATAGPRRRVPTSCQPSRRRAGWSLVSNRSPA